jgi:hypothetical protein
MSQNVVHVVHRLVATAVIVVGPMGVLMPLRACLHTEPTTVGMSAIGNATAQVSESGMHLMQCVKSAAGMEVAFGGKVAPERV